MADDELEEDRIAEERAAGGDPPKLVELAFDYTAYNWAVPLHRLALAGLTAMNQDPAFDPEKTRVIILLQDGDLACVAPLNYRQGDTQTEAVIGDIVEHARSLAAKMDFPIVEMAVGAQQAQQNGETDEH